MKKMMILGAGVYQVPLIQKAKELGFYTIVVSYAGNYPGFALADKVYTLDTTDSNAILEAARLEGICGICTTGTDVAVSTLGTVCDALNLCGISSSAAALLTDKAKMKEMFAAGGVRTASFRKIYSLADAENAFHELGAPIVLKVTDSSGSRGVLKVNSISELSASYLLARTFTRKPYLLAEAYIDGYEIGIDAFVQNHRPVLLLPHTKLVYRSERTTVPVGHHFPFSGSPQLMDEISCQVQRIIDASGMNNCALNIDAFVVGDELYIIEAGGRCGATCIPELISLYGGIDYYGQMIKSAAGERTDFTFQSAVPCYGTLLFSERRARIGKIDRDRIAGLAKEGIFVSIDYPEGTEVSPMANGTDRIGQMYAAAASHEDFEYIRGRAWECIQLV